MLIQNQRRRHVQKCWPDPRNFLHIWADSDILKKSDGKKRSRLGEEQIVVIFKQQEAGMAMTDVCRRHGVNIAAIYKEKTKFRDLKLSDAMLDNVMPKWITSKNGGARR